MIRLTKQYKDGEQMPSKPLEVLEFFKMFKHKLEDKIHEREFEELKERILNNDYSIKIVHDDFTLCFD